MNPLLDTVEPDAHNGYMVGDGETMYFRQTVEKLLIECRKQTICDILAEWEKPWELTKESFDSRLRRMAEGEKEWGK